MRVQGLGESSIDKILPLFSPKSFVTEGLSGATDDGQCAHQLE
jgi:hypothetical protein